MTSTLFLLSLMLALPLTVLTRGAVANCGDETYSGVINVNCESGSERHDCGGSEELPCKSINLAVGSLQNDTCISIPESVRCQLNETVNITGFSNIVIAGNPNLSIVCDKHNAALYVALSEKVKLLNFTLEGCGTLFDSASVINNTSSVPSMAKVKVAVYVINVTDLTLEAVTFQSNKGFGLAVYNTGGTISLTHCNFLNNTTPPEHEFIGGGGVLLHYSYCTPGVTVCNPNTNIHNKNNDILIDSCRFIGNAARGPTWFNEIFFYREQGVRTYSLGKGGGLSLIFSGNSTENSVVLKNSSFFSNSAQFGGALEVLMKDGAQSNSILLLENTFENNSAVGDGGALRVAIEFYNCPLCVNNNTLQINDTEFVGNTAKWGGAVEFFSSQQKEQTSNAITFFNSLWDANSASNAAAAVDIAPDAFDDQPSGTLPIPTFEDCVFVRNRLDEFQTGILNVQSSEIHFKSSIIFKDNVGTALFLTDTTAVLVNGTTAEFINNTANTGGAICFMGSSRLQMYSSCFLNFTNNHALEYGGAMYFYSADPSLSYSYSCFLDFVEDSGTLNEKGTEELRITFFNNTALTFGQAIFASTLYPCARAYGVGSTMAERLSKVFTNPPFDYIDPYTIGLIGTLPHDLRFRNYETLVAIPGQVFETGIKAFDELGQMVEALVHVVVVQGSQNASINPTYLYTANGRGKLTGSPDTRVELSFHATDAIRPTHINSMVVLAHCPPGFYQYDNNVTLTECKCSAEVPNRAYDGVFHCDADDFEAFLSQGYWGGCLDNSEFVTAQCPLGFCSQTSGHDFILPHTCQALDEKLCGPKHRTGILCGECEENYTVHYHSYRYECRKCKYPEFGILFYILSELVPLTIIFAIIILCGISFTSGPANSFIFFAQVLNFFDVTSYGSLPFPSTVLVLTEIYQGVFGVFNLDFFKGDQLSFCLWKNANILDLFLFKYVTTVYALTMVVVLVLALRYISRCYMCMERIVLRRTITFCLIQGISALLIISYAQCAKVSFQILTVQSLRGAALSLKKNVVFLSGKTDYFSYKHLPYAIPALFVLVLTTIPPVILILHPSCTKRCRKTFEESGSGDEEKRVSFITLWNTRLVPFFDSFQGCFKDNCRYFAGLYFIYRLAISMAFALTDSAMLLYFVLEIIVIIMLALHGIVQPYQNPFFNILDAIIFADLAIINGLSMLNFYMAQFRVQETVAIISSIQLVLIYLPLLYMITMVLLKISARLARVREFRWFKRLNRHVLLVQGASDAGYRALDLSASFSESNLPSRLFEEDGSQPVSSNPSVYGTTLSRPVRKTL